MNISLRPALDSDREFLFQVYASTRTEELSIVPWTPQQTEAFLRMQFDLQDRSYHASYSASSFFVIEDDLVPIGRLYVAEVPHELHVIDIALLPEWRNRGIGTALLREQMERARALNKPVGLYVDTTSPARRLYERLGFEVCSEDGFNTLMRWQSAP